MFQANVAFVIVFFLFQIMDLYSTEIGLSLGAKEGNPLMKWMIDKCGWRFMCTIKLLFPLAILPVLLRDTGLTILLTYFYSLVIVNNLLMIRRLVNKKAVEYALERREDR